MIRLSDYLKMTEDAPGLYVGPETPANLEMFVRGFDAASAVDYHYFINRVRGPGNRGISALDEFSWAFDAALEGAREAEEAYGGEAATPMCANCDREATCFGSYDGLELSYACDTCCGHGCEDGHCFQI